MTFDDILRLADVNSTAVSVAAVMRNFVEKDAPNAIRGKLRAIATFTETVTSEQDFYSAIVAFRVVVQSEPLVDSWSNTNNLINTILRDYKEEKKKTEKLIDQTKFCIDD